LIKVRVPLDHNPYDVVIGAGAREHLADVIPSRARRAAVVTQEAIPVEVDPGVEHRRFVIGQGEQAKTMSTVESLCSQFTSWGLTRGDVVVAVGGGVVCDTAGFAAAVYHRGVAAVHVATTLLAQVDAAIGGKTGVNLPEGKNLVGAFWQPVAVLCDTDVLSTLPRREYRSGLGELAKYHFLSGDTLDGLTLDERVGRAVAIKAEVVAEDEHETTGRRATLNYGHTLAHALETAGRYDLRHGEAVGIGLVFAAELAATLGRIDGDRVAYHRSVVGGYDLPLALPPDSDETELVTLMTRDKKALEGLTFALDGPKGVELVSGVDAIVVHDTLERMRSS
jgi:5-deoxy-5-amino-3-dehydroquinate synthase